MTQITRRDALRAGLALTTIVRAVHVDRPAEESMRKPKRFEEVCGLQAQQIASEHPLGPGYSGHVSEASAEKGRKLVQIAEDGILKLIDNWLSHAEAPGSW